MKRWLKVNLTCYEMRRGHLIKVTGLIICTQGMLLRLWHSFERRGLIVEVRFQEEYQKCDVRAMGHDVNIRCHFLTPISSKLL